MDLHNSYGSRSKRSIFAAAVVAVLMLFMGVPRLHADDEFAECRHKTEKAEAKLDDAIARHGEHSHEAATSRWRTCANSAKTATSTSTSGGTAKTRSGTRTTTSARTCTIAATATSPHRKLLAH